MRNVRLALPLLLLLGGCHKDDPASVAVAKPAERPAQRDVATGAPSGGKDLTAAGVTLTFPKDWTTFDVSKGQIDAAAEKAFGNDPNGPQMLQTLKAATASGLIKMFVFDLKDSKPGFANNANLIVTASGGATIDQSMATSKSGLEARGAKVETSKVNLPAGEFGLMKASLKGADGREISATSYTFVDGDNLDVVTFSCPLDQAEAFGAKADAIMKTFRR